MLFHFMSSSSLNRANNDCSMMSIIVPEHVLDMSNRHLKPSSVLMMMPIIVMMCLKLMASGSERWRRIVQHHDLPRRPDACNSGSTPPRLLHSRHTQFRSRGMTVSTGRIRDLRSITPRFHHVLEVLHCTASMMYAAAFASVKLAVHWASRARPHHVAPLHSPRSSLCGDGPIVWAEATANRMLLMVPVQVRR